jgi:hypothetical protein
MLPEKVVYSVLSHKEERRRGVGDFESVVLYRTYGISDASMRLSSTNVSAALMAIYGSSFSLSLACYFSLLFCYTLVIFCLLR